MMLKEENVRQVFALYSGEDLSGEDDRAALGQRLCAESTARARIALERAGEDQALQAAAESWAAALAWAQLCLLDEAAAPQSVTADGVRLEEGESAKKAGQLLAEKRRALNPWLGEEGFYFGGTEQ